MSIGKGNAKQLKPGDSPWAGPLHSDSWNEVVETMRAVRGSRGIGTVGQGGELHSRMMAAAKNCTIGIIDDSDRSTEDGWPDFSGDNRYWVKVWTTTARAASSPAAVTEIENLDLTTARDMIVPATNLAERNPNEISGGSHLLQNGTVVMLWEVQVGDNRHWVFWEKPASGFWCQLGVTATPIDELGEEVEGSPDPCEQFRWKYEGTEVRRTATGWEAVLEEDGGRVVEGALNATESSNDGTGTEGHGADVTACAATPEVYTLPANTGQPIVWMRHEMAADGTLCYSFEFQNALKVTC